MKKLLLGILTISTCLSGCSSTTYPYSHVSDSAYPAKEESCKFRVLSALPSGNYEEIGVFNIAWGHSKRPTTPGELTEKIRPDVCKAGGDFVVGDVNGYGVYVRATLFKYN